MSSAHALAMSGRLSFIVSVRRPLSGVHAGVPSGATASASAPGISKPARPPALHCARHDLETSATTAGCAQSSTKSRHPYFFEKLGCRAVAKLLKKSRRESG